MHLSYLDFPERTALSRIARMRSTSLRQASASDKAHFSVRPRDVVFLSRPSWPGSGSRCAQRWSRVGWPQATAQRRATRPWGGQPLTRARSSSYGSACRLTCSQCPSSRMVVPYARTQRPSRTSGHRHPHTGHEPAGAAEQKKGTGGPTWSGYSPMRHRSTRRHLCPTFGRGSRSSPHLRPLDSRSFGKGWSSFISLCKRILRCARLGSARCWGIRARLDICR